MNSEDVERSLAVDMCMGSGLASGRDGANSHVDVLSAHQTLGDASHTRERAGRVFDSAFVCPDDLELCQDQSSFRVYGANLPIRRRCPPQGFPVHQGPFLEVLWVERRLRLHR